MRLQLLIFIFLNTFFSGFSQKKYDNWGVISQKDLDMTVYDHDSLAPAVILHDVGDIRVLTDHKGDWVVDHTHIRRIKIFDVSALKEGNLFIPYRAGLDAVPVLISTVDNGRSQPEYPFLRQFNSVVACVRDGEKRTLIDASSPFLPVGQMQLKHCNKEGWIVDRKKPEWVKIKPAEATMTWRPVSKSIESDYGNYEIIIRTTENNAVITRSVVMPGLNAPASAYQEMRKIYMEMGKTDAMQLVLFKP